MNPKITKKHAIVLVVALIALFIMIVGGSYAFFTNTVRGKEYVIYSGTLAVSYEKKTNVVNLNNTKPMTNTEGLATTAYSFDVKNTGTIEEKYQVRLEEDTTNTLPLEYVKISVYKNDTELLKPTKLSEISPNLVIGEGELDSLDSDNYKVRLWVDINTPNDMVGKEFKARVVIDAMQNVEEGFAVDTKPIITLNKDSNNNTNLILNVGDTYTELGVESVRDDKDTISPNNVAISGTVNTNVAGIYTVTYSVTDSDNNTSTTTRTVAVNDGSLPIYRSISEVVSSFNQSDLQEAVVCSHIYGDGDLYLDCEIKNTLENAIAARNVSTIILTNNLTKTGSIEYAGSKDITLELNGYNINKTTGTGAVLYGSGKLDVRNSSQSKSELRGLGTVINPRVGSKLVVSNVDLISENTENSSTICTSGEVIINSGTYIEGPHGIGCFTADGAITTINGGTVKGTIQNAITMNSGYNAKLVINNGNFYGKKIAVLINNLDEVEIHGGIYIGEDLAALESRSTKTVAITQENHPIYISTLVNAWNPAIKNNSTGRIIITGSHANQCTNDSSDTTSGLCVYAEGDKNATGSNTGNGALQNISSGTVEIDGGTYYGYTQGINNRTSGNLIIKNAIVSSTKTTILNQGADSTNGNLTVINTTISSLEDKGLYNTSLGTLSAKNCTITANNNSAVVNGSTGTINICNSTISAGTKDLHNNSTGTINYTTDMVFTNNTNTPTVQNPNGTVTQVATCPIVD